MLVLKKAVLSVLFSIFTCCVLIATGITASAAAEEAETISYVDNTVIVVIDQQYLLQQTTVHLQSIMIIQNSDLKKLEQLVSRRKQLALCPALKKVV